MFKKKSRDNDSAEASNWYKDRYQSAIVWRNLLALISLAALVLSALAVLAVWQIAPLKSVEPFVIQVDSKSGLTQVVNPKEIEELSANQALNNFFVIQYIRAREGYDRVDFVYNQQVVRAMSATEPFGSYYAAISPQNKNSPAIRLGVDGLRTVKIHSITYINPSTAQARITVSEQTGNQVLPPKSYVVLIEFKYPPIDLNVEDRFINPLGFVVTKYRMDEETVR